MRATAAVAGNGIEAANEGAVAAARGKMAHHGADGETADFGIALIAKMQTLTMAVKRADQAPEGEAARVTAQATGSGSKAGKETPEPLVEKPPRKLWEGVATAPVEGIPVASLNASSSPEPVSVPQRQELEGPRVDFAGAQGPAARISLPETGKSESSALLKGVSPMGISSPGAAAQTAPDLKATDLAVMNTEAAKAVATSEELTSGKSTKVELTSGESTKKELTSKQLTKKELTSKAATSGEAGNGQTTGVLGELAAQNGTGLASGGILKVAPAGTSSIVQEEETPRPALAANAVMAAPHQSSLREGAASQGAGGPAREVGEASAGGKTPVAGSTEPDDGMTIPLLSGIGESSMTSVAASMRFGQSAAASSAFVPVTGKSAGKSTATGGAVGGSSMPVAAGGLAAGIAEQGGSGLGGGVAPFAAKGDVVAGRASAAAVIAPGESFRQIDTAEPARIVRMAPNRVEVGVNDPAHGWVEVRAESASGQIHASLSASSLEAQAALHARLPEMAGYLADREIGVRSLAVDHGARGSGSFAEAGGGSGGQGREFSGGADPNTNGGSRAAGASRPQPGGGSSEGGRAMQPANAPAAEGYSPHRISVLA